MPSRSRISYDPHNDYYEVLGIPLNADLATIQKAYRNKAKTFHPDLNPDREAWARASFQRINEAYSVLSNVESRQTYNNLRQRYRLRNDGVGGLFTAPRSTNAPRYTSPPRPVYREPNEEEALGAWLSAFGLDRVRAAYVTFVELFGSPYRYVLFIVTAALILNLVFIVAGLVFTRGFDLRQVGTKTPMPTVTLDGNQRASVSGVLPTQADWVTPTALAASDACDPSATFHIPERAVIGIGGFTEVYGTVNHPDMRTYAVTAEYLGLSADGPVVAQFTLKPALDVSLDQPVTAGYLADLDALYNLQGYYRLRLDVQLMDGTTLPTCYVIVR